MTSLKNIINVKKIEELHLLFMLSVCNVITEVSTTHYGQEYEMYAVHSFVCCVVVQKEE